MARALHRRTHQGGLTGQGVGGGARRSWSRSSGCPARRLGSRTPSPISTLTRPKALAPFLWPAGSWAWPTGVVGRAGGAPLPHGGGSGPSTVLLPRQAHLLLRGADGAGQAPLTTHCREACRAFRGRDPHKGGRFPNGRSADRPDTGHSRGGRQSKPQSTRQRAPL